MSRITPIFSLFFLFATSIRGLYVIGSLLILGLSTYVLGGPSYSVECEDVARGTKIHLFDANPSNEFMSASGTHNQLPEGMESFKIISKERKSFSVTSYKPYEVELTIEENLSSMMVGDPKETKIGTLEKVILENHSAVEILEQPRLGAITLVLSNGLEFRFNNCIMRGDVSISEWNRTFDPAFSR